MVDIQKSPFINRIKLLWHGMRDPVIEIFPREPGISDDKETYLAQTEELYTTDAYHSLSIERYVVTPELIERVRSGAWDAAGNETYKKQIDALAARGYWQAFKAVKESIRKILDGENAGIIAEADHSGWYRELFSPGVLAGLLKPSDLAGYRNSQVYIGQSRHTPPNKDALRDVMPALSELLKSAAFITDCSFLYYHAFLMLQYSSKPKQ